MSSPAAADIDSESEAGLKGLTRVLSMRTSIEAADPWPVDVAADDLALFPLLYWPVPPDHPDLAAGAVERVEAYLAQGGMILFDTRDAAGLLPGQEGGGPGERRLAELLRDIDLPPLMPLPADHVLTRSFYLLQDFPGRWAGQPIWVDQAPAGINDGVSGVIIGANEWAGAWAEDEIGEPLCSRSSPAARPSARWPAASASTSPCTRSPATTRPTRSTCRRCWSASANERHQPRLRPASALVAARAPGRAGARAWWPWPSGAGRAAPSGAPSSWPSCSCSSPTRSCAARSAHPSTISSCCSATARPARAWPTARPSWPRPRPPCASGSSACPASSCASSTLDGESRQGSRLFTRLREGLAESDRARLGAVVALTDGQAHDAPADPATLDLPAPLHVLLTGRPDESDRQLAILKAPSFGVVGEPQVIELRVDDVPGLPAAAPGVPVTVRQDGRIVRELTVAAGEPAQVPFTLDKAGNTVIEVEAAARPGELTTLNNRATLQVSGVRDRLRVLVVSGQPYPGLRVWRNLLKADPAVDLVHFTILRPPEKQDGTPIRELALIAFPSRELFEVKLKEFDLIIFDNYSRRGLLPLIYLENIARYVEEGGALLEAAGPQFAEPMSLYRTPLARVLPGRPTGEIFERGFRPAVTEAGQQPPGHRRPQRRGRARVGPLVPPARRRDRGRPGADDRRLRPAAAGAQARRRGPRRPAAVRPRLAVGARLRGRRPAGAAAAPPGPLADEGAAARGGSAPRQHHRRRDPGRAPVADQRAARRHRHRPLRRRVHHPPRARRGRHRPRPLQGRRRTASTASPPATTPPMPARARSPRSSSPTCAPPPP